jgi:polyisoprenyl-teichoic acid--peptidoglycan teichoic acid transferase
LFQSKFIRVLAGKYGIRVAVDTVFHLDPLHTWTPEQQFPNRSSLNVLVLGVDHDYNNRDQIVKTSPGRSDSILLAHVDFANKTIQALTIPRDTGVNIPGRRGIHKINAAHNLGGPRLTMETIQSVFGVKPDCVVTVSLEGFVKIIDAIGGIHVTVRKQLDYDDNWGHLHIHLKPGFQHMTGYQAMGYVRMRHSDSDFMRSQRQHEFLEALRERVKQPSAFRVLGDAVDRTIDALTLTDLNHDQLLALGNFARTLDKQKITLETLPSFEGPSMVRIDVEKSAEVIRRMFFANQQVAVAIEAPDPGLGDAWNSRYGGGRHRHKGKKDKTDQKPAGANEDLLPPPDDGPNADTGAPDGGGVAPPTDGGAGPGADSGGTSPSSGDGGGSAPSGGGASSGGGTSGPGTTGAGGPPSHG